MVSLKKHAGDILFWGLLIAFAAALGRGFYEFVVLPDGEPIAFEVQGRSVEILAPWFFGALLGLPILWVVQKFTLSDLPRWQRWINIGLRASLIVALVGALVQVVLTSFESRVATVFLVDTSASIPEEVLDESVEVINEALAAKGERDEVKVLAFARQPYQVPLNEEGALERLPRPDDEDDRLGSDIAAALRMSYGMFPQDHLKRVVVISDGNSTDGDFIAEAYRAEAYGIRLFNEEIPFESPPEVLVRGVDVPNQLKVGEPFVFTARVFSTSKTEATLTLWQNEFKDGTKRVALEPGMNEVQFETEVYDPGFREFKVNLTAPDEVDTFAPNNTFVYSANVRGKPRILYLEGEMRTRHYLQRALRDENFEVETRGPFGVPTSLEELEGFDLVLMSDVAALNVSNGQMRLIERYVRELGGGFIMAGGESAFGPGGYKGSTIEKMLPVRSEPKKERKTPSLGLVLVIDKSGSMGGDKMELAKEAAKAAVEVLKRNDKVGVIGFDDTSRTVVRMQSATNRVRINDSISRIRPSGGTNIAAAMQDAYEKLAITPARLKHIILLSDGNSDAANIFSEILPALRIENITVSSVAVGADAGTTLLRRVAEGGGGRYYYTNDPYNVPRIFMKETNTVSRNSLVEEPFRPVIAKRAQVLKGIPWESAPYLLGFVTTRAKDGAEVILEAETGEPLLARWRYGLGKSVAFTSDLKNRWAVEWIRWPGYSKFWSQLIRDTMRSDDRDTLAMRTTVEQGRARVVVDAVDDEDRFINDLNSTVKVTTPDGETGQLNLRQTAPGRYEASVALDEFGSYNLKAQHDKDGDTIAVSLGTVSYPYPREYLFTEPDRDVLRRAADIARGETNPDPETLFDPMGEEVTYREELWPIFLMAALALLVLDLIFRRLRLGGATELGWEMVTKKS